MMGGHSFFAFFCFGLKRVSQAMPPHAAGSPGGRWRSPSPSRLLRYLSTDKPGHLPLRHNNPRQVVAAAPVPQRREFWLAASFADLGRSQTRQLQRLTRTWTRQDLAKLGAPQHGTAVRRSSFIEASSAPLAAFSETGGVGGSSELHEASSSVRPLSHGVAKAFDSSRDWYMCPGTNPDASMGEFSLDCCRFGATGRRERTTAEDAPRQLLAPAECVDVSALQRDASAYLAAVADELRESVHLGAKLARGEVRALLEGALRKCWASAWLPDDLIALAVSAFAILPADAEDDVAVDGSVAVDAFTVVTSGEYASFVTLDGEPTVLARYGVGDAFNESALLCCEELEDAQGVSVPSKVSLRCMTSTGRRYALPAATFRQVQREWVLQQDAQPLGAALRAAPCFQQLGARAVEAALALLRSNASSIHSQFHSGPKPPPALVDLPRESSGTSTCQASADVLPAAIASTGARPVVAAPAPTDTALMTDAQPSAGRVAQDAPLSPVLATLRFTTSDALIGYVRQPE